LHVAYNGKYSLLIPGMLYTILKKTYIIPFLKDVFPTSPLPNKISKFLDLLNLQMNPRGPRYNDV
jgi:hypothetical protein